MWSWLVGKVIHPFLPYILGALVALGIAGSIFGYIKGRSDMDAKWKAKELEQTIYAQAQTIQRYRKAAEETAAQAARELQAAQASKSLIEDRVQQVETDNAALEAQIAAMLNDKEKTDVVVKILREKCVATGADVDLDRRLREQQGSRAGVPGASVSRPRGSKHP